MRLLALLVLIPACATESAAWRASDAPYNAPGAGAYYEITVGQRTIGDVKVWSNGARVENDQIIVEMGLRIRNNIDTPITIDPTGSGVEVTEKREVQVVDNETKTDGPLTVPAGGMARVTLTYTLPAKTDLDNITGFDFYWRLSTSDGAFTRSTAFQRVAHDTGGIYYQPYFYGGAMWPGTYWGWGGGWGGGIAPAYRGAPRGAPMRAAPPRR